MKVQLDSIYMFSYYGLIVAYMNYVCCNCAPLGVTSLQNLRDLEFDLTRPPNVVGLHI